MTKRAIIIAAAWLVMFAAVGLVYLHTLPGQTTSNSTRIARAASSSMTSVARAKLVEDLSNIASQFVDDKEYSYPPVRLSAELENIKSDIRSIMAVDSLFGQPVGSHVDFVLHAVGNRYVVLTVFDTEEGEGSSYVLDSMTLQSNYIDGFLQFATKKLAVYVSAADICTYIPDQPSCVELPGAKLPSGDIMPGSEVYGDDTGRAGYFIPQDLSHTSTTLTIALLKWPRFNTEQDGPGVAPQKIKDVTFVLPQ